MRDDITSVFTDFNFELIMTKCNQVLYLVLDKKKKQPTFETDCQKNFQQNPVLKAEQIFYFWYKKE